MHRGLVGREHELLAVEEVVAGLPEHGAALVVSGEPGIGKSALLDSAVQRATGAGCTVVRSVGVESEADLPYAGLQQLLAAHTDRFAELAPAPRAALLTAFGLAEGARPEPYLVALAALNVIVTVARDAPVVIVADDVQWLDPLSQEVLAFLARRAPFERVVVFAAIRAGHASALLDAGLPELELAGLDDTSAAALLQSNAPSLSSIDRQQILDIACGNPLALLELPSAWDEGGALVARGASGLSARLERAFGARLASLPPRARDTLLVAAINSRGDIDEIVHAASRLSGVRCAPEDLAPAIAEQLCTCDANELVFRHPLVRSSIVGQEGLTRRQAAHAALAATLEREPYRRTWHRAQSIIGPDDDIADELEANVEMALNRGDVIVAIRNLERAAQLTRDSAHRGHRYLIAAEHAFSIGRADVVDHLIQSTVATDLTALDAARMQWLREIFDEVPGDATRVREMCEAARLADASGDKNLALNLLLGAGLRCWWADTGPDARRRVVQVADAIVDADSDARYVAGRAVADPIAEGANVTRLLDRIERDAVTNGDALRLFGMAAHAIGDEVRAADFLASAECALREQNRFGLLPHVLSMQVMIQLELGGWEHARVAAEEGQRLARETGQPIWSAGTLACEARGNALRGNFEDAMKLAAEVELSAGRRRLNDLLSVVQLVRGTAYLSVGAADDAYAELARLFRPNDPSFHRRDRFAGIMPFVDAAVSSGHQREAERIVDDLRAIAATTPSPILHVHLLYANAVLAPDDEAESRFGAALDEPLGRWPWMRAKIQLAYGRWLVTRGRAAEAAAPLATAAAELDRIGGTVWFDAR